MRVVVIGGGISGLSAAWRITERAPHAEVTVLEASAAVGGKLRVARVAGIEVDVGAEAMLARRGEGVALVTAAGLGAALIEPSTTAASVYVGGARHRLPARTLLGVPGDVDALRGSGVLSAAGLAVVDGEPSRPGLDPLTEDVAVGALVRGRLGDEVVDRLVEPLLGGVYAGHADRLSLRATMPALAARLREGGSLVRAAAAVTSASGRDGSGRDGSGRDAPERPGSGPDAPERPGAGASGPVFVSLTGGLGGLPAALVAAGRFTVRPGVTVRAIRRIPTGFALDCGSVANPELVEADAVVVATPPGKAARLLHDVAPTAAAELSTVDTASVAIITLAYRDVTVPPGSGLLVGTREERRGTRETHRGTRETHRGTRETHRVKAVTVSSQKWPITPDGLTILRASVGRAGESADLHRDDAELIALVRAELPALLGVHAEPVDARVTRWGGGLPQYAVGHVEAVARIRAAVAGVPGLAVCGATYDGVGIPACIASGWQAAEAILAGAALPTREGAAQPTREGS